MSDETAIRHLGLLLRDRVEAGCRMASLDLPDGTKAVYRAGVLVVGKQSFTSEWLDGHGLEVVA